MRLGDRKRDMETNKKQPMPFEEFWNQIMAWVRKGRFDLIKISARKRLEAKGVTNYGLFKSR